MIKGNLAFLLAASSLAFAVDKPRVFVSGESSFQVNGSTGAQQISGTADPTTAEGIKLLQENCPNVSVNMRRDLSDYIVSVTDDGSGPARKGRKAIVFTSAGDLLAVHSTRSLKSAIKDTCSTIEKNWATHQTSVAPKE